jgi:hypothetical protein
MPDLEKHEPRGWAVTNCTTLAVWVLVSPGCLCCMFLMHRYHCDHAEYSQPEVSNK